MTFRNKRSYVMGLFKNNGSDKADENNNRIGVLVETDYYGGMGIKNPSDVQQSEKDSQVSGIDMGNDKTTVTETDTPQTPSEQPQVPTPDPQPEDTPYTLTTNGGVYFLNSERVSVEFEDKGATVIVPYNHNNEDNPATQIYLKFTYNGYTFNFVKTVIRMPSPLCSIKHPKSYSDACTHEPPDRRRPPHAERRSSPQGCTRPTQYPAFARPCTP